ncbi:MAG: TetR/AcrR family transcriptional regulator [Alphaproteobacteria bacterium]|nr:MAG: TetR/AcrR family transcriptional regulator [Alphaproteobacteria bacterium]
MRKLKIQRRHDKANSDKGRRMVEKILAAARDVLINEGYPNLTMRKIAQRAGITLGNLSYYYANKQDLLYDLVDAVLEGYRADFDSITENAAHSPQQQLAEIIRFVMRDLTTKETTHFFPELWALANHDRRAADCMENIYRMERGTLAKVIARMRPDLSAKDVALLALFLSASMEGHTMFIGHNAKHRRAAEPITNIAAHSFLALIETVTPASIRTLGKQHSAKGGRTRLAS